MTVWKQRNRTAQPTLVATPAFKKKKRKKKGSADVNKEKEALAAEEAFLQWECRVCAVVISLFS